MATTVSLGAWQGVGSAAAPTRATAPVQQGNTFCGTDETTFPVIGSATFTRSGNKLTVSVALSGANPKTTYDVVLFGDGCAPIGPTNVTITTNGNGSGHGRIVDQDVSGNSTFFVDPYDPNLVQSNDTPYVSLP